MKRRGGGEKRAREQGGKSIVIYVNYMNGSSNAEKKNSKVSRKEWIVESERRGWGKKEERK